MTVYSIKQLPKTSSFSLSISFSTDTQHADKILTLVSMEMASMRWQNCGHWTICLILSAEGLSAGSCDQEMDIKSRKWEG